MAEGQADRVVLFKLAVITDEKAEAEAQKFSQKMQAIEGRRQKAALDAVSKRASAEERLREKAEREAQRAAEREQREEQRRADAVLRTRQRLWREQEKANEKAIRDQEKAANQYRASTERMAAANRGLVESTNRGMEGLLKLGEGVAKLGLVGEKDMQKVVDGLLKIRGGFDLLRGGLDIWRALSDGVGMYRRATEAAAAAQLALSAAQAKGAATGGASGAAGAAGAGLAGAAGAKLSGMAGLVGMAPWLAAGAGLIGSVAMGTNVGGVRDATANAMARAGWFAPDSLSGRFVGWTQRRGYGSDVYGTQQAAVRQARHLDQRQAQLEADRAAQDFDAQRISTVAERRSIERMSRMDIEQAMIDARRARDMIEVTNEPADFRALRMSKWGLDDARRNSAKGLSALGESQGQLAALNRANAPDSHIAAAEQEVLARRREILSLRQAEIQLVRQTGELEVANHQKATGYMEARANKYRSMYFSTQDQIRAGQQQWGQLNEGQRSQLIRIGERINRGERVSREEEQLYEQVATPRQMERLNKQRAIRGESGDNPYSRFTGTEMQDLADAQMRMSEEHRPTIRARLEHSIRLEINSQQLETALREELTNHLEEIETLVRNETRRAKEDIDVKQRQWNNQRFEQQRAAGGAK